MSEQKSNRCIVLLPAGDPHYTKLFDELFALAITKAGLVPYRISQSPTQPLPIEVLVQEISRADAVFADLSQNSLDIWFALGCALTLKKPLCLISSRLEFSLPLDIQDLEIVPYPVAPFPSDYSELEQNIIGQLLAKLPTSNTVEAQPNQPAPPLYPLSLASRIAAPPIDASAPDDLTSHEVLALTIIDLRASQYGLSPRDLGLEMQASDAAHLTSHAMNALKRRNLIERRQVPVRDGAETYISDNLFITRLGESWLLRHGKRKNSILSAHPTRELFISNR